MLTKMKVMIPCLLIAVLVGAIFAQETPTPLTDKEKLQAAEAFILLQNSQQQMLASPQWQAFLTSPQWQAFQQHQREYGTLLQGFRLAKGVAANCTLTVKQDWSCPVPLITQSTQGANSPNVVSNKGDVNIKIGDEQKEPDGEPEPEK